MFEATAGYLLHLLSFGYSWVIWYPVACFFMTNVYRKTGKLSSVFFIGLLSAAIKMLNLFLPGRIDKVINPAISIVFEAVSMATVVFAANHMSRRKKKSPLAKALMAICMNTGWRLLYVIYLLFLAPSWIRDVSVVSSSAKFIPFFITQNLITTLLIYIGYQYKTYIFKPLELIEHRLSTQLEKAPSRTVPILQPALAALLLCANIALQFTLK
jgi:hypothetical protein